MGGVISFGDTLERNWFCAGWCYGALLDAVLAQCNHDPQLVAEVQSDEAHQIMNLESLAVDDPDLALRLLRVVETVARKVVEGDSEALAPLRHLTEGDRLQYRKAVAKLLELIQRERRTGIWQEGT